MSPKPSPSGPPVGPPADAPQVQEQKRAAVRLRLASLPAEVWALEATSCRRVVCKLINISEGGLLVEAEEALEAGARVYCRFTLPKGPQVANPADVVRAGDLQHGHVHMGLRFSGMSNARRDLLVRWIFAELASRSR